MFCPSDFDECKFDWDCAGETKKCCSNTCYNVCIEPAVGAIESKYKKLTPIQFFFTNSNCRIGDQNRTAECFVRIRRGGSPRYESTGIKSTIVLMAHLQECSDLDNRPFATSDHVVENPPCWKASALLFPHWDIKTKRPEPVKLDLPLF